MREPTRLSAFPFLPSGGGGRTQERVRRGRELPGQPESAVADAAGTHTDLPEGCARLETFQRLLT